MSKFRIIASTLNVREEPNTNATVLRKLPRGTVVEPTDLSPDEAWFFIDQQLDGKPARGWLFKDYLVPLEAEPPADGGDPAWLTAAIGETGVTEVPGPGDNPKIIEYHRETSLKASDDAVPWCSSFANWCMRRAGIQGSGKANARSWLDWGERLEQPRKGCVVVLKRGSNPAQGHVGFYVGDGNGRIRLLGGNQGNAVKISLYPKSMILGYRWPSQT